MPSILPRATGTNTNIMFHKRFEKLFLPYKGDYSKVFDILKSEFRDYAVDVKILDCSDYSVPLKRERIVYRVYKKETKWPWPKKSSQISLRNAVGKTNKHQKDNKVLKT